MAGDRVVYWSGEAKLRVDVSSKIQEWTWVEPFLSLLQEFETLVKQFPHGYQVSATYPGVAAQ